MVQNTDFFAGMIMGIGGLSFQMASAAAAA